MNKKALSLLILLTFSAALTLNINPSSAESNIWTTKASMQVARANLGAAVVNGQIYAIGGVLDPPSWIQCTNVNEKYDPETNTWSFQTSMPTPRASFAIAVCDNKIYCIGGTTGVKDGKYVTSNTNEVYDPETNSWSTKASMPTARIGVNANVIDGKIYLIGGNSTQNEVYNPTTDTWTTMSSIPTKPGLTTIWSCTSTIINEKIHVFGANPYSKSHQIYDPKTDNWTTGTPIIQGCLLAQACTTTTATGSKAICVFAVDSTWWDLGPPNFSCLTFNTIQQTWRTFCCMPTPRVNVAVAVINDLIYVIGGSVVMIENSAHPTKIVEVYYSTKDLPTDNQAPTVTFLSTQSESYHGSVPVNFTVNKPTSSLLLGIDGEKLLPTNGNTTLNLTKGNHNLTVYAVDINGNIGGSNTISFNVIEPQQYLIYPIVTISAIVITLIILALLIKKRKNTL